MEIYTIGFTRKSVKDCFEPVKQSGIERLVDVRVNNTAQLAVSPPSVISPISVGSRWERTAFTVESRAVTRH